MRFAIVGSRFEGRSVGLLAVVLALAAGVLAFPCLASTASAAESATAGELDAALDRIVAGDGGPPGVSVLIQRGGKREYRSRGFANIDKGLSPTAKLPMRIASVSKSFSGAVALALVARGDLSLGDTIGERLPGLLPRAKNVTLRQALNHTGGLPDYIRDDRFLKLLQRNPARSMSPRHLLSFVRNTPLSFRPGTKYEYSDTDNVVVGLMAEAVTGKSYNRLLRELVFRPLKLRHTTLPNSLAIKEPFLHGYDGSEDVSRLINPVLAWASGGMVSTPTELNRFIRAYVSGRLFKESDGRRSTTQGQGASLALRRIVPQRAFVRDGASSPPGPGHNASGLGLFRYRTPCGTVFGHTGSFPGYRMFAAASRDGRRSVVFAVNAQIVPGQGSAQVSNLIRRAQTAAVCHALR